MFSVRIVSTSHYLADPVPEVDVCYSSFRSSPVRKVPVLRIFGPTPAGQKTCLHVHGVFPYMYVPYDGTQPVDIYLRRFAASLDKAINVANNNQSNAQHVFKISMVAGIPMYGYHPEEQQFLKIYLYNPNSVRKAADLLLGGAVMNKAFQPHESHIPFPLQLFIDYNLYGMNMINMAAVKFRRKAQDDNQQDRHSAGKGGSADTSVSEGGGLGGTSSSSHGSAATENMSNAPSLTYWDMDNLASDMLLPASVERQSVCELEVDVVAADILNRRDVTDNMGKNPGLAAIWEDEQQRRRDVGQPSQITPQQSQEHDHVERSSSEQGHLEKFSEILGKLQAVRRTDSEESEMSVGDESSVSPEDVTLIPASQLEDHSQPENAEDSEQWSQDTVVVEDKEEEGEDDVVISLESIQHVVSFSQSFSQPSSQPTSTDQEGEAAADQSLVEVLAALAEESSSPAATQRCAAQVSVLEDRDSVVGQGVAVPPDSETLQQDEEDTLTMSQTLQMHDGEGYDVEGLDSTWNGSPEAQAQTDEDGDDDDDDDSIPQLDGASDPKPASKKCGGKRRLGVRGPMLSSTSTGSGGGCRQKADSKAKAEKELADSKEKSKAHQDIKAQEPDSSKNGPESLADQLTDGGGGGGEVAPAPPLSCSLPCGAADKAAGCAASKACCADCSQGTPATCLGQGQPASLSTVSPTSAGTLSSCDLKSHHSDHSCANSSAGGQLLKIASSLSSATFSEHCSMEVEAASEKNSKCGQQGCGISGRGSMCGGGGDCVVRMERVDSFGNVIKKLPLSLNKARRLHSPSSRKSITTSPQPESRNSITSSSSPLDTSTPSTPSSYTFTFHIPPAPVYRHHIRTQGLSTGPEDSGRCVRMHPMDTQLKDNLGKIGREVVRVTKLTEQLVSRGVKNSIVTGVERFEEGKVADMGACTSKANSAPQELPEAEGGGVCNNISSSRPSVTEDCGMLGSVCQPVTNSDSKAPTHTGGRGKRGRPRKLLGPKCRRKPAAGSSLKFSVFNVVKEGEAKQEEGEECGADKTQATETCNNWDTMHQQPCLTHCPPAMKNKDSAFSPSDSCREVTAVPLHGPISSHCETATGQRASTTWPSCHASLEIALVPLPVSTSPPASVSVTPALKSPSVSPASSCLVKGSLTLSSSSSDSQEGKARSACCGHSHTNHSVKKCAVSRPSVCLADCSMTVHSNLSNQPGLVGWETDSCGHSSSVLCNHSLVSAHRKHSLQDSQQECIKNPEQLFQGCSHQQSSDEQSSQIQQQQTADSQQPKMCAQKSNIHNSSSCHEDETHSCVEKKKETIHTDHKSQKYAGKNMCNDSDDVLINSDDSDLCGSGKSQKTSTQFGDGGRKGSNSGGLVGRPTLEENYTDATLIGALPQSSIQLLSLGDSEGDSDSEDSEESSSDEYCPTKPKNGKKRKKKRRKLGGKRAKLSASMNNGCTHNISKHLGDKKPGRKGQNKNGARLSKGKGKKDEQLIEGVHYIVVGKFKGYRTMVVKLHRVKVTPGSRVNANDDCVVEKLGNVVKTKPRLLGPRCRRLAKESATCEPGLVHTAEQPQPVPCPDSESDNTPLALLSDKVTTTAARLSNKMEQTACSDSDSEDNVPLLYRSAGRAKQSHEHNSNVSAVESQDKCADESAVPVALPLQNNQNSEEVQESKSSVISKDLQQENCSLNHKQQKQNSFLNREKGLTQENEVNLKMMSLNSLESAEPVTLDSKGHGIIETVAELQEQHIKREDLISQANGPSDTSSVQLPEISEKKGLLNELEVVVNGSGPKLVAKQKKRIKGLSRAHSAPCFIKSRSGKEDDKVVKEEAENKTSKPSQESNRVSPGLSGQPSQEQSCPGEEGKVACCRTQPDKSRPSWLPCTDAVSSTEESSQEGSSGLPPPDLDTNSRLGPSECTSVTQSPVLKSLPAHLSFAISEHSQDADCSSLPQSNADSTSSSPAFPLISLTNTDSADHNHQTAVAQTPTSTALGSSSSKEVCQADGPAFCFQTVRSKVKEVRASQKGREASTDSSDSEEGMEKASSALSKMEEDDEKLAFKLQAEEDANAAEMEKEKLRKQSRKLTPNQRLGVAFLSKRRRKGRVKGGGGSSSGRGDGGTSKALDSLSVLHMATLASLGASGGDKANAEDSRYRCTPWRLVVSTKTEEKENRNNGCVPSSDATIHWNNFSISALEDSSKCETLAAGESLLNVSAVGVKEERGSGEEDKRPAEGGHHKNPSHTDTNTAINQVFKNLDDTSEETDDYQISEDSQNRAQEESNSKTYAKQIVTISKTSAKLKCATPTTKNTNRKEISTESSCDDIYQNSSSRSDHRMQNEVKGRSRRKASLKPQRYCEDSDENEKTDDYSKYAVKMPAKETAIQRMNSHRKKKVRRKGGRSNSKASKLPDSLDVLHMATLASLKVETQPPAHDDALPRYSDSVWDHGGHYEESLVAMSYSSPVHSDLADLSPPIPLSPDDMARVNTRRIQNGRTMPCRLKLDQNKGTRNVCMAQVRAENAAERLAFWKEHFNAASRAVNPCAGLNGFAVTVSPISVADTASSPQWHARSVHQPSVAAGRLPHKSFSSARPSLPNPDQLPAPAIPWNRPLHVVTDYEYGGAWKQRVVHDAATEKFNSRSTNLGDSNISPSLVSPRSRGVLHTEERADTLYRSSGIPQPPSPSSAQRRDVNRTLLQPPSSSASLSSVGDNSTSPKVYPGDLRRINEPLGEIHNHVGSRPLPFTSLAQRYAQRDRAGDRNTAHSLSPGASGLHGQSMQKSPAVAQADPRDARVFCRSESQGNQQNVSPATSEQAPGGSYLWSGRSPSSWREVSEMYASSTSKTFHSTSLPHPSMGHKKYLCSRSVDESKAQREREGPLPAADRSTSNFTSGLATAPPSSAKWLCDISNVGGSGGTPEKSLAAGQSSSLSPRLSRTELVISQMFSVESGSAALPVPHSSKSPHSTYTDRWHDGAGAYKPLMSEQDRVLHAHSRIHRQSTSSLSKSPTAASCEQQSPVGLQSAPDHYTSPGRTSAALEYPRNRLDCGEHYTSFSSHSSHKSLASQSECLSSSSSHNSHRSLFETLSASPMHYTHKSPVPSQYEHFSSASSYGSYKSPVESHSAYKSVASHGVYKSPGSSHGVYKSPGSSHGVYKSPGSSHRVYKSPGSSHGLYKSPGSSHGLYKSPGSSHGVYKSPSSSHGVYKSPGSSHGAYKSPASSHGACKSPVASQYDEGLRSVFTESPQSEMMFTEKSKTSRSPSAMVNESSPAGRYRSNSTSDQFDKVSSPPSYQDSILSPRGYPKTSVSAKWPEYFCENRPKFALKSSSSLNTSNFRREDTRSTVNMIPEKNPFEPNTSAVSASAMTFGGVKLSDLPVPRPPVVSPSSYSGGSRSPCKRSPRDKHWDGANRSSKPEPWHQHSRKRSVGDYLEEVIKSTLSKETAEELPWSETTRETSSGLVRSSEQSGYSQAASQNKLVAMNLTTSAMDLSSYSGNRVESEAMHVSSSSRWKSANSVTDVPLISTPSPPNYTVASALSSSYHTTVSSGAVHITTAASTETGGVPTPACSSSFSTSSQHPTWTTIKTDDFENITDDEEDEEVVPSSQGYSTTAYRFPGFRRLSNISTTWTPSYSLHNPRGVSPAAAAENSSKELSGTAGLSMRMPASSQSLVGSLHGGYGSKDQYDRSSSTVSKPSSQPSSDSRFSETGGDNQDDVDGSGMGQYHKAESLRRNSGDDSLQEVLYTGSDRNPHKDMVIKDLHRDALIEHSTVRKSVERKEEPYAELYRDITSHGLLQQNSQRDSLTCRDSYTSQNDLAATRENLTRRDSYNSESDLAASRDHLVRRDSYSAQSDNVASRESLTRRDSYTSRSDLVVSQREDAVVVSSLGTPWKESQLWASVPSSTMMSQFEPITDSEEENDDEAGSSGREGVPSHCHIRTSQYRDTQPMTSQFRDTQPSSAATFNTTTSFFPARSQSQVSSAAFSTARVSSGLMGLPISSAVSLHQRNTVSPSPLVSFQERAVSSLSFTRAEGVTGKRHFHHHARNSLAFSSSASHAVSDTSVVLCGTDGDGHHDDDDDSEPEDGGGRRKRRKVLPSSPPPHRPSSSGPPHSIPRREGDQGDRSEGEGSKWRRSPEAGSSNSGHVLCPRAPPPSRAAVEASASSVGLSVEPVVPAFCSHPADLPDAPRELGGRVLRLPTNTVRELEDLPAPGEGQAGAGGRGLGFWQSRSAADNPLIASQQQPSSTSTSSPSPLSFPQRLQAQPQLRFALTGDSACIITPVTPPPSGSKVKAWLQGLLLKVAPPGCGKQSALTLNTGLKAVASQNSDTGLKAEAAGAQPPAWEMDHLDTTLPLDIDVPVDDHDDQAGPGDSGDDEEEGEEGSMFTQLRHKTRLSGEVPLPAQGCSTPKRQRLDSAGILHSTPVGSSTADPSSLTCTPIREGGSGVGAGHSDSRGQEFVTPRRPPVRRVSTNTQAAMTRAVMSADQRRQSLEGDRSQIDAATPKNAHGFKVSQQKLQDAKALHKHQYLTVLSMELHADSRGDLTPDPEVDAIRAVFYGVFDDIPEEKGRRNMTGAIVVDKDSCVPAGSPAARGRSKDTGPKGLKGLLDKCGLGATEQLNVAYVKTELDLLHSLVCLINRLDPDMLVGFEIQQMSWGFLLQRAAQLSVNLCAQIARISGSKQGNHFSADKDEWGADYSSEIHIEGRIVLNLWRILRHEVTLNIYSYENCAYHILHCRLPAYTYRTLTHWYSHRSHLHTWRVVDHYTQRVRGQLDMLDRLDLIGKTSEFARVFGIEFYDVLSRGSQYRVESMMLRVAKPLNFIPVSPSVQQRARQKAAECIPLTLEPQSMMYTDPVVVLDFQSLYPSIMIAYNYCFSTCLGRLQHLENAPDGPFDFGCTSLTISPETLKKVRKHVTISPNGCVFVTGKVRRGVLPMMVEEILNTRLMVKKSMKEYKEDKTLHRLLDARQLGLKLIANVTYGYTGASFSGRMPCIEVGDSIVRKARESLERAIQLVEGTAHWQAQVVYGDTDSLFIRLPGRSRQQAFVLGQEMADAVTNMFPKPMKLKFEKVYLPCVLQTKKRYVGMMYETPDQQDGVFDAKGIETVRRDNCGVVSKVLERCIKILFLQRDVSQVRSYLHRQITKMMAGRVGLQDFVFAKEYRGMMGYKPGACVPALEIARKRLREDRRGEPRVGERVPYVIVHGSPGLPLIQLVRQPRELLRDPALRINITYYISKQVLPPLDRLLSLVGVSVFQWYRDMPKVLRVAPSLAPAQATHTRQGTISQYFVTSDCLVCERQTKEVVCAACRQDPQMVAVSLASHCANLEALRHRLTQVCQTCTGAQDASPPCVSLDCPVLFRRHLADLDLARADLHREALLKLSW